MTRIRGGKQIYDELEAAMVALQQILRDILDHSTSVRYVERSAEDGQRMLRVALGIMAERLDPMLERRDKQAEAELAEIVIRLQNRIEDIEARTMRAEHWIALAEQERRMLASAEAPAIFSDVKKRRAADK